jgi:proton glutamate symport protein
MLTFLRRVSLTQWILIAMVIGVLVGWLAPEFAGSVRIISKLFLRMIKLIIVPILFSTLVVGIAGHGDDLRSVGRLAIRSIIYFEVVTTLALVIGLGAVNFTRPGDGVQLRAQDVAGKTMAAEQATVEGMLEHAVPQSFFEAATENNVLQVVVFAIIFGIALAMVRGPRKDAVLGFCEGLSEVMFAFTGIVMKFAPIGVGAAIAYTVSHSGIGVLINLGKLVLTMYGALLVFIIGVLLPVTLLARIPVRRFWQAAREPVLIAFSTTSSDAALPAAFEKLIAFGVPKRIVSFVIPLGYSFNLDGSTLYLAVASIFVAQAAGIELTTGQQLLMMLTLMLTSKGVAGVPRASLVILSGTLVTFGLPLEGVAILLGIDEIMDMGRTSVNLLGNCLAATVMARIEGDLDASTGLSVPASRS